MTAAKESKTEGVYLLDGKAILTLFAARPLKI